MCVFDKDTWEKKKSIKRRRVKGDKGGAEKLGWEIK